MTHRKKPEWDFYVSIGLLIVTTILVLVLAGCESIFGPKSETSTDSDDEEARIIVSNGYGETLDIYMGGTLQFTITDGDSKKIKNVSLDEHDLEAKRTGTGTVVDDTTIDVTQYTDYTWAIGDPPDINVTNKYGVSLKVYMNGTYLFDLADEENRWIMNVAFGEHFMKALKVSDGKEVASTTIDVEANKDYAWTIQ